jgi:hypothetical protein
MLCGSCSTSWAQEKRKLDSLTSLLRNYSQEDSARFGFYGELCWLYATTRSETDIAKMYADSIYYLALALNDPRGEASAHFYYGCIGRFEGNFAEALKHRGCLFSTTDNREIHPGLRKRYSKWGPCICKWMKPKQV